MTTAAVDSHAVALTIAYFTTQSNFITIIKI